MRICSRSAGTFKLFDPIIDKEYTLKDRSLVACDDYFQMLLFAKHGWVLVLWGEDYMYAANPFTGEMLVLQELLPWQPVQWHIVLVYSRIPKLHSVRHPEKLSPKR